MSLRASFGEFPSRSVANIDELSQIETGTLVDGDVAYTQDSGTTWVLLKSSSTTLGATVRPTKNSGGGVSPGRWVDQSALQAVLSASEAVWYIDATSGDDANSGTSAAAPLATFREWYARNVGDGRKIASNKTIHILSPMLSIDDPIDLSGVTIASGVDVQFVGALPTADASTTVTMATDFNPATNTYQSVQSGLADVSAYVGLLVVDPTLGVEGWIDADNGAGDFTSNFADLTDPFAFTPIVPVAADVLDFYDPLRIDYVRLFGVNVENDGKLSFYRLRIQTLSVSNCAPASGTAVNLYGAISAASCKVINAYVSNASIDFVGSWVSAGSVSQGSFVDIAGGYVDAANFVVSDSTVHYQQYTYLDAASGPTTCTRAKTIVDEVGAFGGGTFGIEQNSSLEFTSNRVIGNTAGSPLYSLAGAANALVPAAFAPTVTTGAVNFTQLATNHVWADIPVVELTSLTGTVLRV